MTKDLKDKAIDFKGKKYVVVSDRVIYFNETYPNGSITTELISQPDADLVIIKATVMPYRVNEDGSLNDSQTFTGFSQATWGEGFVNKTAALENAETSAVGRALAFMGIGVLDSIASVDEINKAQTRDPLSEKSGSTSRPAVPRKLGRCADRYLITMHARITVASATEKTTKGGKPYLNVKSENGAYFNIWSENQFIFHKFVQGAELTIDYTEDGKFKTIVGIVGLEGENPTISSTGAGNGIPVGAPNAMTWIVEQVKEMNKKLDWLIEERKTLGLPEEKIGFPKVSWPDGKEPNLSDLPVTDLPDLN